MKVGCRLSTFRTELSQNSPCIAALKTEMFGTFIFKHAQATKSHGVGIKSANSICCKKPRVEGHPGDNTVLGDITPYQCPFGSPPDYENIRLFFCYAYIPAQLRQKLAPRSSNNKEQPASLSSSSNDQLTTDSPSSSIAAEPFPSLHLNGSPPPCSKGKVLSLL